MFPQPSDGKDLLKSDFRRLYAIGSIGLGQVAVSAVICVLATVATARLAASVYERLILGIGARVRLREALRSQA